MASLSGTSRGIGPAGPDDRLVVSRVTEKDHAAALSLLLTGRSHANQSAVDHFTHFASEQNLSLDNLWVAARGGQMVVSALIVPCAGRTGMLFLSPHVGAEKLAAAVAVARAASLNEDPQRVRLIQSLLEPGQEPLASALESAGYRRLAWLVYMHRKTERQAGALALPSGLTAYTFKPSLRPLFSRAILASYQDTQDCPGLLGLREIDDIVDGHMATGRFLPDLWMTVYRGDEPVAVMLLNYVPQREAIELVYLGVSAAWRGKGLARPLLTYGLNQAARNGAAEMILAVDQENAPAIRLYQSLGFVASARKMALVFVVN